MKTLKQILIGLGFTAFILKVSYIFGFILGLLKGALSYFCYIGVSQSAVDNASAWLVNVGIIFVSFRVYEKFFK